MKTLFTFIAMIAIIVLAFTTIGSIGYGLYLWGGTGMALGLAAWTAFKVWITVGAVALVTLLISITITKS